MSWYAFIARQLIVVLLLLDDLAADGGFSSQDYYGYGYGYGSDVSVKFILTRLHHGAMYIFISLLPHLIHDICFLYSVSKTVSWTHLPILLSW